MNKEFRSGIIKSLRLLGLSEDIDVTFEKVVKNNNSVFDTIVLKNKESNIGAVFYLKDYDDCETLDEVAIRVYTQFTNMSVPEVLTSIEKEKDFINKSYILDNVVYKLINADMNRDRVKDMPSKEFLDLVAVYFVAIDDKRSGFEVTNKMMEAKGITYDELDFAAKTNTIAKGVCSTPLQDVLNILGSNENGCVNKDVTIFVMTNLGNIFGANVMLNPSNFIKLSKFFNGDLYILPSSIHEILVLNTNEYDINDLRDMVMSVNKTVVSDVDILSNNIYRYSCKANNISVVSVE